MDAIIIKFLGLLYEVKKNALLENHFRLSVGDLVSAIKPCVEVL
jgi:hypothetical protein